MAKLPLKIYRSIEDISTEQKWRTTYKFKDFIKKQYQFNDKGQELIVNTRAHKKIKTVFEQLTGKNDLTNPDAAIRYFHPIIEPYEITYGEFTSLFKKPLEVFTIREFILNKWNLNSKYVFSDFIKRLNQREFKLSERLYSALALMDLNLVIDPSIKRIISETNLKLWEQIISLLGNDISLNRSHKYKAANQMILDEDFSEEILELWEKKYKFIANEELKSSSNRIYQLNKFYRFFLISDYVDDSPSEIIENLKFLLEKIINRKFQKEANKISCLLYSYKISGEYWSGENHARQFSSSFNDALSIYLKSLFSLININKISPPYILKDCELLFDGLKFSCDTILFESENLEKLIYLFKKKILAISTFINGMEKRHDGCNLTIEQKEIAREKLMAYIKSKSDYNQKGYEETIDKFFKTNVIAS